MDEFPEYQGLQGLDNPSQAQGSQNLYFQSKRKAECQQRLLLFELQGM